MLSPARSNAAGRCIYCAFRSRQIALESLRQRSTQTSSRNVFSRLIKGDKDRSSHSFDKRKPRDDGPPAFRFSVGKRTAPIKGGGRNAPPFAEFLPERLKVLAKELEDAPVVEHVQNERREEGGKPMPFEQMWKQFTTSLRPKAKAGEKFGLWEDAEISDQGVTGDLMKTYKQFGERGLDDRIKYHFYGHVTGARFTESDIRNQRALADLRYPTEWYPATRTMRRTIHLHVGPTNSGKTYHALQRLEKADKGAYAGPLRLLAHEVYTRMSAKGKPCTLVTGEERRLPEDNTSPGESMTSCTVEMMPLNTTLDVAVIDEIQMIGNADRGWAWTQALLGVKAKEVHLCGETRTIPLIKELCASMGEKLEIHEYQRLSPLKVADQSLNGKLNDLRKGDCIVSFSVMGIHALRRQIERATSKKVAIVYGSLPPETRAQQARLFNDPDNDYDYLVASDAVGMGLNLAIKRIIFEASNKYDGYARRTLSVADIKQIAGRAGRYRTAAQGNTQAAASQDLAAAKGEPIPPPPPPASDTETLGLVTTLEKFDFPIVRAAMQTEPEPIRTAGLFPPGPVLQRFSSYFPQGTPFSYVLTRLHELSLMHKRFHLCGLRDQIWVADLIEPVQNLSVEARSTICASPASQTDMDLWRELLPAYARCIAEQNGGNLLDIPSLPLEVLDQEPKPTREYLRDLERLHKGLVSYLWLSYRFAGIFTTRALAFHVKAITEEKIENVLAQFSFSEAQRKKLAAKREKDLLRGLDTGETDEYRNPIAGQERRVGVDGGANANPEGVPEHERNELQDQTVLSSGGDRFGGEEDITFEEPEALDAEAESPDSALEPSSVSFAEWRNAQVPGESQGSDEDASFETASREGEKAGRVEGREGKAENEPTVAEFDPAAAFFQSEELASEDDKGEGAAREFEQVVPETELGGEQPPVRTQEAPPTRDDDDARADVVGKEKPKGKAGEKASSG